MSSQRKAWLLVTDVDDTLLGDDQAYMEFVDVVRQSPDLSVVLNSSRPLASVQQTLASLEPKFEPAAIIAAMGTEIFHDGKLLDGWTKRFEDWSREPIDEAMATLGFAPHADEYQTPLKASFEVPGARAQQQVREAIRESGQPAKIICSGESSVDVLPPNGGKGDATLYVAEILEIDYEQLIVAGDSANDIAMFDVAMNGIVVGNAWQDLRDIVDAHRAYHANRTHAGGLLEGLMHFEVPLTLETQA